MFGYLRYSFLIHGKSPKTRPPTAKYAKNAATEARAMRVRFMGYSLEGEMGSANATRMPLKSSCTEGKFDETVHSHRGARCR